MYQLISLKLYSDTCFLTSGGTDFDVLSTGRLLIEDGNFHPEIQMSSPSWVCKVYTSASYMCAHVQLVAYTASDILKVCVMLEKQQFC